MEIHSYNRPQYQNRFAEWMQDYDFTHAVTLSCPTNLSFGIPDMPSNEDQGKIFRGDVDCLIGRLPERVFGRGQYKQNLLYATFYECWGRSGSPTFWHAHCLFLVPVDFFCRFEAQIERQWARILGPSFAADCINIKRVDDLAGAARYATKYAPASTGEMIDACLPALGDSSPA